MDKLEQYIKMCEKAEEIQGLRPTNISDDGRFLFFNNGDYKYVRYGASFNDEGFSMGGKLMWLPRQDQLQEMVFDSGISAIVIAHELSNFALTIPKVKIGEDMKAYPKLSMEQLWLAFVMKEKYNKVWDGDSWKATTI